MAVNSLKLEEWKFVLSNFQIIPLPVQIYFEEVSNAGYIEDHNEFERQWYSAIGLIQDQHEDSANEDLIRDEQSGAHSGYPGR